MNARRLVVLTVLVVAVSLFVGCSPRPVSPVVIGPAPAASASVIGTYAAGSRVQLQNGASLGVPAGWDARVTARGGYISDGLALSGVAGGMMLPTESDRWGSVVFSVFGPRAGFASQLAVSQKVYDLSRRNSGAHDDIQRVVVPLDAGASATAFVVTPRGGKPLRAVYAYITIPGADPIAIAASFSRLSSSFAGASDVDTPRDLLDYLGFRVR